MSNYYDVVMPVVGSCLITVEANSLDDAVQYAGKRLTMLNLTDSVRISKATVDDRIETIPVRKRPKYYD